MLPALSRNPQPPSSPIFAPAIARTIDELTPQTGLVLYSNTTRNLPSRTACNDAAMAAEAALHGPRMSPVEAQDAAAGLLDALPRQAGDEAALAARIATLASALREYPAAVAREAIGSLLRSSRWAPVPADIHAACEPRMTRLRLAVANARAAIKHMDALAKIAAPVKPSDPDQRAAIVARAMAGIGKGA